MALKNFKTRNGIDVDTYTLPNTVLQATVKTNSATTIDTLALNSFTSAEYLITITQDSKIRTSKVIIHTDGTSVYSTEHSITETGGVISGVNITATTASTNAILQATITDAATTIARIKMSRNLNVVFTPVTADAPTIGTATGGAGTASITFTAPYDNGGATITSYRATSTPGSITGTSSSSPVTVSGLTGGTAYTFVVAAINSAGVSAASAASNSVTPTTPPVEAAYFAGGLTSGGSFIASIDKMNFPTETTAALATGLSLSRQTPNGAFANSGIAGYVGGGSAFGPVTTNTVEKFTFSGDSRSSVSGGLSGVRKFLAGVANSGTAGYFAGGSSSGPGLGGGEQSNVDKFAFSNDSRSSLATGLASAAQYLSGFANSGTAGYFFYGTTFGTSNKFAFSNDSRTSFSTGLTLPSTSDQQNAGSANSGVAGYMFGDGNASNTAYKMSFSNDTFSSITNGMPVSRYNPSSAAKSGVAAYVGGGTMSGSQNNIQKLTFSNDTGSAISATLPTARADAAGFANSGTL